MADLVLQYKTNRGYYINQYVDGQFGIAFSGNVQVNEGVVEGKTGIRVKMVDPVTGDVYGEYAFGIRGQPVGLFTVTYKTITDVITGETREVTEVVFNAPIRRGPHGAVISAFEKVTIPGAIPLINFNDGTTSFGLAATFGGALPTGHSASVGVKLDLEVPNYSVDINTHFTPQSDGSTIKVVYTNRPGSAPGFGLAIVTKIRPDGSSEPLATTDYHIPTVVNGFRMGKCFAAGTLISLADGSTKPIEDIRPGDLVLAFRDLQQTNDLMPCVVTRLFSNVTEEWLVVRPLAGATQGLDGAFQKLTVTPGHRFLTPNGMFCRIDEILARDSCVVLADGTTVSVTAERIGYSAATAHLYEEGTIVDYCIDGNTALSPQLRKGWKTYNFEVNGLHTYIANGIRVHNESLQPDDVLISAFPNPLTGEVVFSGIDKYHNPLIIKEVFDENGELTIVERNVSFKSNDAVVRTTWTEFDESSQPVGEPERDVAFPNAVITGEQIGSIFGSSLGQLMGGENIFTQVAAGSALSAVLSNVGETLHIYFNDTRSLSDPNSPALTLSQSADAAFRDIRTDFANALQSQAIGAVSSFLTGELAEALGFDGTSFGDQLLRVASSSLINTALTNLTNIALGVPNTSFLTGISGNLASGVGSFLGSYLAHTIVQPENIGGSIGGSIGGALGTAIGSSAYVGSIGVEILTSLALAEAIGGASSLILGVVLPGIGAFIGVLLGTLLGNVIGSLFGPPAHWAGGGVEFSFANQQFAPTAVSANYDDLQTMVIKLNEATAEVLNAYLGAIGGEVMADGRIIPSFYATTDGPLEKTFVYSLHAVGETGVDSSVVENSPGGATAQYKLNYAVINTLKRLHVAGGNLYIKRAIDKSTATTLQQLSGEIKIAEDYGRYLANKDIIDALIAQNPDSAFAAGWIVTLLRAEELGITQLHKTDFYGGIVPFLKSFNLERFGASLADVSVALDGNKLLISIGQGAGQAPRVLEIVNYAQMAGLNHLVASPTGTLVNGGNGDDLWIAANGVNSTFTDVSQHFDTLSNDVLIGGSGIDTINAGVGADLIFGGAGNDLVDAGTGDDVVTGGTGNDTIQGGAGDDVFVFNRGDGTDTIGDIGVVIDRDVVNDQYGRDPEAPLFVPYISSIAVGTVISGGSDTLQFGRGISVDDLIVRFVGANLVIAVKDPAHPEWGFDQLTDKIQLSNWLDTKQRVETFQFADGTVLDVAGIASLADVPASMVTLLDVTWDAAGLNSTTNARIVVGTGGNDAVAASDGIDIVFANGGNDTVAGGAGNDWLDGGTGDDSISGGAGNDIISGGTGIDTANGGAGWDKAVFGLASTSATIVHNANGTTTVTYTGGSEVLTNVEVLQFTDKSVAARTPTPNDFLADTTSDVLFWNHSTGDIGFYAVNSNGDYAGWNSVGSSPTAYSPVGTGDFNGDGTSDILFRNNTTGQVGFYRISSGSTAEWHSIADSSTAYNVVGVGDFNGDGTSDILFRNNATGDTGFYQISNGVYAGWHGIGGSSTAYTVVGVGDFNGDTVSDILFRNNTTGDTGFYQLNPDGSFQGWHWIGGSSPAYSVEGIGDFNGDGTSDILFRNNTTGDTGFYQINNGVLTGWHSIGGSSPAYSVEGIGDFNGDGTSDILFRNNMTGDTGFYQISNGALQGWHWLGGSSTDYFVVGGAGINTLSNMNSSAGVTINLASATAAADEAQGDSINASTFSNIVGSAFNDLLTGSSGNNVLNGGAGNDTLTGNGYDKYLIGRGWGQDTIVNGTRADIGRPGRHSIDLMPAGNAIHFADGSAITGTSAYTRTDGTTGVAGDVSLAYAPAERGGDAIDASLGQLIQAMATYSTSASGFDAGPFAATANDATPQVALAAAWHP